MEKKQLKFRRTRFTKLTDSQWQRIKEWLEDGRKRKYDLRKILDAILKITRTGCQWRNQDEGFPPWEIVYYYFRKWQKGGQITSILAFLVEKERERQGRNPKASAAAVDSQSVRKGSLVSVETGFDGGKLVNGRKRHLAVDTLGLPLAIYVSSAKVHDGEGGLDLLWRMDTASDRLELIRADKAYRGVFKDGTVHYKWEVEISQRPESKKGFVPETGRWQVERTFAWFNFFRRLARDVEKTVESSVTFIQLAFIDIILSR